VRGQLEDAMKQASFYANQIAQDENDQALAGVKKSGKTTIYEPTKDEKLALKKAMAPVHEKMADRVGKETLQSMYKATGFNPGKL
jgi:C4-dicarboxylate-binding protein DctP